MKLNVGDEVRVQGERGSSKVRAVLADVHGALLETEIAGYRNWNLDELILVKRAGRRHSKMTPDSRARIKAAGMLRESSRQSARRQRAPRRKSSPKRKP